MDRYINIHRKEKKAYKVHIQAVILLRHLENASVGIYEELQEMIKFNKTAVLLICPKGSIRFEVQTFPESLLYKWFLIFQ